MRVDVTSITVMPRLQAIAASGLTPPAMRFAMDRLELAAEYIGDGESLGALLHPGRTIVVDLRDEWIERDEALALFLCLTRVFTRPAAAGVTCNKLLVFDEAHKYMADSALTATVVETARSGV